MHQIMNNNEAEIFGVTFCTYSINKTTSSLVSVVILNLYLILMSEQLL
jgi:hypothetical protein